ncbi:MAG: phosphoribosylamine--glycine ligase [Desulfitobacteriaceae bacterium]|nr:phosphoribosylamine--glycine ligase [Desulfitobacteriaceae bacterium]
MKVLVVGGGGREHALVWKLAQSPKVDKIFCAPGNAGIARLAECIDIASDDINALLDFAVKNRIDMTVVGPEAPLTAGLADRFAEAGLKVFGPAKRAAEIEGSKTLAKEIMEKYQIPTAKYRVFTEAAPAIEYIKKIGVPVVVKADGLAAGKGVIIAEDMDTALSAVKQIMEEKVFGAAGNKLLVEEFLEGEEVSVLAFSDGTCVVPMVSSQDHKRAYGNDQEPNTGGMGAYSPAPVYTTEMAEIVLEKILQPTIDGLKAEGRTYRGVIYAGLMITKDGPKVLEYNARFGDPEAQPVLMRLETDLVDIMESVLEGRLKQQEICWSPEAAVCVVLASGGYPGTYEKGKEIFGLNQNGPGSYAFHAGTAIKDAKIVTSGGRVLGVTARSASIEDAISAAYKEAEKINFAGVHYRRDIGAKALNRKR